MSRNVIVSSDAEIIKRSVLSHYDRMIKWMEKQERPDRIKMLHELGEDWSSNHCLLCKKAKKIDKIHCEICPVSKAVKKTTESFYRCPCNNSPWFKMVNANTIEKWLLGAKEERDFLESLDYSSLKLSFWERIKYSIRGEI